MGIMVITSIIASKTDNIRNPALDLDWSNAKVRTVLEIFMIPPFLSNACSQRGSY